MAQDIVTLTGLSAGYDRENVLEGIDFSVMPKDFIGLVGPNGGGKSSMLKVMLGLLPVQEGTVRVLGKTPKEVRHRIGYVPQVLEFNRDFPIRVREVVHMGRLGRRRLFQRYSKEDHEAVEGVLERVDLVGLADHSFRDLSGGQKQRVLLARALAVEPELLLLDEPTASMDAVHTRATYELLAELNKELTIVMVTHDMGVISSYVKTVGCLNRTLHYHGTRELSASMLEAAYQCPIELIAHGVPHRVFPEHGEEG